MSVLGTITIRKLLDENGDMTFRADYEGVNIFESIGVLQAELDYQLAVLRNSRQGTIE